MVDEEQKAGIDEMMDNVEYVALKCADVGERIYRRLVDAGLQGSEAIAITVAALPKPIEILAYHTQLLSLALGEEEPPEEDEEPTPDDEVLKQWGKGDDGKQG